MSSDPPRPREQPWSDESPEHGQVVVVTGNPIGRAVVQIAEIAGRRTTLLPDEDGDPSPLEWLAAHPLGEADALVLCDHDTPDAGAILRLALDGASGYVAMMGSRRRAESVFASLEESWAAASQARRRGPARVNKGGKAPREIARYGVAEMVATSYDRPGGPMKSPC